MITQDFPTADQAAEPQTVTIPNNDQPGNDLCCSPMRIVVPMLLIWDGHELIWHPETMDQSAAERMAASINVVPGCFAKILQVVVVLPAAGEIEGYVDAENFEHDYLSCEPLRARLQTGPFSISRMFPGRKAEDQG